MRALSLCILLAACTPVSTTPPPAGLDLSAVPDLTGTMADLSTVPDLTGTNADLSMAPDLTGTMADLRQSGDLRQPPGVNVVCGGLMTCTEPKPICCSATHGLTGTCVGPPGVCATGIPYFCDAPDDCPAGSVCCLTTTQATCMTAANCATQMGTRLCASKADCMGTEQCCGFTGVGGGVMHCTTGPCPV